MIRNNSKNKGQFTAYTSLYLSLVVVVVIMLWNTIGVCGNVVDIDVVKAGTSTPVDTLIADSSYELRIWIENDDTITATTMEFENWSPDDATWEWEDVGGLGFLGCVTVVNGSRIGDAPSGTAFDMTGLLVAEWDIDLQGHDTLVVGGVALMMGIGPGPPEHMISFHFIPGSPHEYGYSTICFDSCYVPPTGDFVWGDQMGYDVYPGILWPEGGKCWTVASCACRPGDANNDDQVNIADAVYIINYVFKGGPAPQPYAMCSGDPNADCGGGVGDAVYLISYIFKGGPAPVSCMYWVNNCGSPIWK